MATNNYLDLEGLKAYNTQIKKYVNDADKATKDFIGELPSDATASTVVGYVKEQVDGHKTAIDSTVSAVDGKVTTLVGSDTDKSVRTIANEELAAQLIPESAQESLDTLKEIADWIQAHPAEASAMNTAIGNLKTLLGETELPKNEDGDTAKYTTVTGAIADMDSRLMSVEAATGDVEALEGKIAEKINELDATVDNTAASSDVTVTITQTDGKITAVTATLVGDKFAEKEDFGVIDSSDIEDLFKVD